jgi:hypothetical protein
VLRALEQAEKVAQEMQAPSPAQTAETVNAAP